MTPKYSQILGCPKKYPQNIQTTKIFIFLKNPKNIEIQNFEKKNGPSLRMYENTRVIPPPRLQTQLDPMSLTASRVESVQVFLRKLMLTCDFPGGSADPLSPSLDPPLMARLSNLPATICWVHWSNVPCINRRNEQE